jgi:hypothetical protein
MNCVGQCALPLLRLMAVPDGDSGWCDGCTLLAPSSSQSISPSDLTVSVVESPRATLCRRPHADALSAVLRAAAALSQLGAMFNQCACRSCCPWVKRGQRLCIKITRMETLHFLSLWGTARCRTALLRGGCWAAAEMFLRIRFVQFSSHYPECI